MTSSRDTIRNTQKPLDPCRGSPYHYHHNNILFLFFLCAQIGSATIRQLMTTTAIMSNPVFNQAPQTLMRSSLPCVDKVVGGKDAWEGRECHVHAFMRCDQPSVDVTVTKKGTSNDKETLIPDFESSLGVM